MSRRQKLPTTRHGQTHKVTIGQVDVYITCNQAPDGRVLEVFCKSSDGWQGWSDALAIVISMALQHGCPAREIVDKLRGMRFAPEGIAGQPASIPDAIARKLEVEK